ncbi:MAG: hypothetical protein HZB56_08265 [Deltaproteobacteria bacterium]|nr:hypothetical protein [Deltaproteobacteria bacterium]
MRKLLGAIVAVGFAASAGCLATLGGPEGRQESGWRGEPLEDEQGLEHDPGRRRDGGDEERERGRERDNGHGAGAGEGGDPDLG